MAPRALTLVALLATAGPGPLGAQAPAPASPRQRVSINHGWRCRKGDPPRQPARIVTLVSGRRRGLKSGVSHITVEREP